MARSRPNRAAAVRRRQPLSRDRIVDAAIALADERGIDEVGMRAVARRLGVDAMSLYNHVDGRTALFDGIAERLLSIAALPGPAPWDDWARAAAQHIQRLALDHPGAFGIFSAHPVTTVEAARHLEPFIAGLLRAGFPADNCALILNTYLGFVASYALMRTATPLTEPPSPAEAEQITAELRAQLPALSALDEANAQVDAEASFGLGVDLLIDGLRARLRRLRRERRAR
jgi:AcrR family transcriptional regulator